MASRTGKWVEPGPACALSGPGRPRGLARRARTTPLGVVRLGRPLPRTGTCRGAGPTLSRPGLGRGTPAGVRGAPRRTLLSWCGVGPTARPARPGRPGAQGRKGSTRTAGTVRGRPFHAAPGHRPDHGRGRGVRGPAKTDHSPGRGRTRAAVGRCGVGRWARRRRDEPRRPTLAARCTRPGPHRTPGTKTARRAPSSETRRPGGPHLPDLRTRPQPGLPGPSPQGTVQGGSSGGLHPLVGPGTGESPGCPTVAALQGTFPPALGLRVDLAPHLGAYSERTERAAAGPFPPRLRRRRGRLGALGHPGWWGPADPQGRTPG